MCNKYSYCKRNCYKTYLSILDEKTLIIDITTHNKTGSIETEKIYQSKILII